MNSQKFNLEKIGFWAFYSLAIAGLATGLVFAGNYENKVIDRARFEAIEEYRINEMMVNHELCLENKANEIYFVNN